jgi:hypothetical protein
MIESGTHRGTALGKILKRTVSTADGDWLNYLWLLPAALGAAVTALLSWSAWITAWPVRWPDLYHAWWWALLRPDQDGTLLVTTALWLVCLASYWWPRRFERKPIVLITIVAMVIIGGVLAAASLVPCRGSAAHAVIVGWMLDLYTGNQPALFPGGACPGNPPLAMQLGDIFCPGAAILGVLASLPALWREPLGRLGSRFAREATVFTGLSPLTLPLLRRLAETARSPRDIIVIEPDGTHPLLDEARGTGARVILGTPSSSRLLRPIIAGWRGCSLSRLYALSSRVGDNESVIGAVGRILRRYPPGPGRLPHLISLIDDPRHADSWRNRHGHSTGGAWFEDALSSAESTAVTLVDHVLRTSPRHVLLCGDSSLALVILHEMARRSWETAELMVAAAAGRETEPTRSAQAGAHRSPPPVEVITLLDQRADDIQREYRTTVPPAFLDFAPSVETRPFQWREDLLSMLDAMPVPLAQQTAVIIVDLPDEGNAHEAGRIARLHTEVPVLVLAPVGDSVTEAIFGQLRPFKLELLVNGQEPEDSWTRIARHWHNYYRLSHPVPAAHPRAATRLPWTEIDPFTRQDNLLQVHSILSAVAQLGRRWVPTRTVQPGSFIELSERELENVAMAEHTRWQHRAEAATRSATANGNRSFNSVEQVTWAARHTRAQVNELAVPWAELPAARREANRDWVRSQIGQLESVGFLPTVPAGGPSQAAIFERTGIVHANRLTARLHWTLRSGEEMQGHAGDWHVIDDAGGTRTVSHPEFQSSHEPMRDGRWRRVGTIRAWQAREPLIVRTKEGRATANPGDWIVEGTSGERWPVTDLQFRRSYRPRQDRLATDGQASTPAAISSSTAPTIST